MMAAQGKKLAPLPSENGGGGVGLSSVLEADVKHIVNMAHETYEKYFFFFETFGCLFELFTL